MASRCMGLFLLLLLVLTPQEVVQGVEPRMCMSRSQLFKGLCFNDNNCSHVCKNEGFTRGKCRGFRRRCFCVKPCEEGGGPVEPPEYLV